MMHTYGRSGNLARARQRGVSMLFALMALVVLALAGAALVRSIDTGTLIMGNLGFKQDTLSASSSGTEQAITWLQNNITSSSINTNSTTSGYYASSLDKLDPTGGRTSEANKLQLVNWDGACQGYDASTYATCDIAAFTPADRVNGNRVQWVITRLCDSVGPASGSNLCMRPAVTATANASERGELGAGGRVGAVASSPYFRIIVRTEGPRNTVTYTETLVHF